jgi:CRP/FNR family transcriptional regulator, cyclic AMP receptor protein
MEVAVGNGKNQPVHWEVLFAAILHSGTVIKCGKSCTLFRQGQPADSLFYLRRGAVKLTAISKQGKEAIVSVLGPGQFFGEGCLAGQQLHTTTAAAVTDCTLNKIEKSLMASMLHERHDVSEMFVGHLLSCSIRYEADLVDHIFNSSESRLAQALLLLAHYGEGSKSEPVRPRVSQESLAQMVGTTRSRIRGYMQKFRKLGFINYDCRRLTVHSGLLSVLLQK